jgi:hypothetical protein
VICQLRRRIDLEFAGDVALVKKPNLRVSLGAIHFMKRRSFLKASAGAAALAGLGDLGFISRLPGVDAAEAKLETGMVQLRPEIRWLVQLLEETPREKLLEEVAARIHRGLSYREILAALLLAGVRNIQPRPVGFKFHAVLVVNSAHLASLSSAESDRWLPIFWALDYFKSSQAADIREGDWSMGPVNEKAVPPAQKAKQAFTEAMDQWDEEAADAAAAGLARTAGAHELFELFCRYGMRDFRDIGHKQIYVANSFRTLEVIGWRHAEPVLRSLAYALLDRGGATVNPAQADLPPDRPFRENLRAIEKVPSSWLNGEAKAEGTREMLQAIREGSAAQAGDKAIEMLNQGTSVQSLFDAYFDAAGEMLMQAPGIISLHAVTFTNAMHYAFQHCRKEETRKLLVLQNAAFLPLFRGNRGNRALRIDSLEPGSLAAVGEAAVTEIFEEISTDRLNAARKVLAYLKENPDPKPLMDAARRLIFLKGRNSHDYKFSSAVLEDYYYLQPPWRDLYLAASVFNLRGAGEADNQLVQRIRAAF